MGVTTDTIETSLLERVTVTPPGGAGIPMLSAKDVLRAGATTRILA